MTEENNSNPKPPTAEEQASFEEFHNMSVAVWSETLKACTRKITAVEKRLIDAEAEIIVLKKTLASGMSPKKGRTDA